MLEAQREIYAAHLLAFLFNSLPFVSVTLLVNPNVNRNSCYSLYSFKESIETSFHLTFLAWIL